MSRFIAENAKGQRFAYGYDRPLQYYFLSRIHPSPMRHLVGLLSEKGVYGSASNLLGYVRKLGIVVPESHENAMLADLPFPEGEEQIVCKPLPEDE